MSDPVATLDKTDPGHPRLVIELRPEQQAAVEAALAMLLASAEGRSVPEIVEEALQTAVEQRYFWTPAWQAKEREAEKAIAEGRVSTFDTMDQMIAFLDGQ